MKIRNVMKVLACLACAGTPLMADLVANGSFETGDFTGWTQGGSTGANYVTLGAFEGYTPHNGNYFAALGSVGAEGTLSQALTTNLGQAYALTFDLASDGSTPNDFTVTFNHQIVFAQTNVRATSASAPYGYEHMTFTTVATSNLTPLIFSFRDDPGYLALDDVSVLAVTSATPEPTLSPLLFLGLSCMLIVRSRAWW